MLRDSAGVSGLFRQKGLELNPAESGDGIFKRARKIGNHGSRLLRAVILPKRQEVIAARHEQLPDIAGISGKPVISRHRNKGGLSVSRMRLRRKCYRRIGYSARELRERVAGRRLYDKKVKKFFRTYGFNLGEGMPYLFFAYPFNFFMKGFGRAESRIRIICRK